MTLQECQKIACYKLQKLIGIGGMGEVWLAKEENTGNQVALKIPTDPEYIKFLKREAVMQAAIDHSNVIQLLEIDLTHNPIFAVMEYFESKNLRQILQENEKLSIEKTLMLFSQILDGVDAAHEKGILHRDLKPENILVNDQWHVKITDFGLGRVHEQFARSLILQGSLMSSAGNSIVGTYDYMSPEQRSGDASEPKADIFALGIILHEMLTGKKPTGNLRSKLEREKIPSLLINIIAESLDEKELRIDQVKEIRQKLIDGGIFKKKDTRESTQTDLNSLNNINRPTTDLSALVNIEHSRTEQHQKPWWRFW